MRDIVIIGGGSSVQEGIEQDLWSKIKGKEIWSINFAFMTMPYLPNRECWVDMSFFMNNMEALQKLQLQGVPCYAKRHMKYTQIPEIKQYETSRNIKDMSTKVFIGKMGLSGFFALHLAIKECPDRIFILGYDFGSKTTNTHYYQNKLQVESSGFGRPELYRNDKGQVKSDARDFEIFTSPDIKTKIYNVSPESAITCFEKISYEQFFTLLEV